jgi:hypothetical protein
MSRQFVCARKQEDGKMATKTISINLRWTGWLLAALFLGALWLQAAPVHAQGGLATVSGEVWLDGNGNGEQESYEPLLANHPVTLISRSEGLPGVLAVRVVTDEDGRFTFRNIQYGDYSLSAEDGPAKDISVSLERSSATVSLSVAGMQLFLPVMNK